jgi:hypothetical protein
VDYSLKTRFSGTTTKNALGSVVVPVNGPMKFPEACPTRWKEVFLHGPEIKEGLS